MTREQQVNWEIPQRQPLAGLLIVFLKTFWEILKRLWPFVLLMIFNAKPDKNYKYEIIAIIFAAIVIVASIIKFFFFRFSIVGDELVINKGWFKKENITVPLHRIQTVHIEESFLHSALGIVKVAIDTAGSSKTEVTIDSLRKPMAEALREYLYQQKQEGQPTEALPPAPQPVLTLSGKDLWRLSISANHVETFFILLSFAFGVYDNLKDIGRDLLPSAEGALVQSSVMVFLALTVIVLLVVVIISTLRIFLSFYDFKILRTVKGYFIKSGLTNVKERMVAFQKIQYLSWRANWVRRQMGIWLLEYHISGGDEMKKKMRVQVPVTKASYIPLLIHEYHDLPEEAAENFIRVHRAYAWRRLFIGGLLPAGIGIAASVYWWGLGSLFFLLIPFWVGLSAFLFQKKFTAMAYDDVLVIDKSVFGTEQVLLKWYKVQSLVLQQSMFQRRKELATLVLYTAGGEIRLPYIPLQAAQQLANYTLYQVEHRQRAWM